MPVNLARCSLRAAWGMMLIGFAGVGFVAYRRAKKSVVEIRQLGGIDCCNTTDRNCDYVFSRILAGVRSYIAFTMRIIGHYIAIYNGRAIIKRHGLTE